MVAAHERGLSDRIAEAKRQAADVAAAAQGEAEELRRRHEAALAAELTELRRQTQRECAEQRETLLRDAAAKAKALRDAADQHAASILDEVMALILPADPGDAP